MTTLTSGLDETIRDYFTSLPDMALNALALSAAVGGGKQMDKVRPNRYGPATEICSVLPLSNS
jgi:hypothetical protein